MFGKKEISGIEGLTQIVESFYSKYLQQPAEINSETSSVRAASLEDLPESFRNPTFCASESRETFNELKSTFDNVEVKTYTSKAFLRALRIMDLVDTILLYIPCFPLLLVSLFNGKKSRRYFFLWFLSGLFGHYLKFRSKCHSSFHRGIISSENGSIDCALASAGRQNKENGDSRKSLLAKRSRWRWYGLFVSPLYLFLTEGLSSAGWIHAFFFSFAWFLVSGMTIRIAGRLGTKVIDRIRQ